MQSLFYFNIQYAWKTNNSKFTFMTLLFFYKMNITDPQSGGSELQKSCLLFGLEELRICRILGILQNFGILQNLQNSWNLIMEADWMNSETWPGFTSGCGLARKIHASTQWCTCRNVITVKIHQLWKSIALEYHN